MTRRRLVVLLLGIVALASLSYLRLGGTEPDAHRTDSPASTFNYRGDVFGTTFSVTARLPRPIPEPKLRAAIDRSLLEVDLSMSTYRQDSELTKLNHLPVGTSLKVSPDLMSVLLLSQQVHDQTNGAFDITVGPLVRAWGFGAGAATDPPDGARVAKLMHSVGMQHLRLDPTDGTVTKLREGMFVDLSAVAKGFGVDQVAASLESEGIDSYLVEVGGEVRVRGRATAERLWRLGIERPVPEERSVLGTLELAEAALATSGDYRNFRRTESGTISHTLDPRTGRPVARKTASVSVVRPTAAEADALATALCVLPHTEAIELATEKGWAVLLLIHTAEGAFESLSSPAWRRLAWRPAVPP